MLDVYTYCLYALNMLIALSVCLLIVYGILRLLDLLCIPILRRVCRRHRIENLQLRRNDMEYVGLLRHILILYGIWRSLVFDGNDGNENRLALSYTFGKFRIELTFRVRTMRDIVAEQSNRGWTRGTMNIVGSDTGGRSAFSEDQLRRAMEIEMARAQLAEPLLEPNRIEFLHDEFIRMAHTPEDNLATQSANLTRMGDLGSHHRFVTFDVGFGETVVNNSRRRKLGGKVSAMEMLTYLWDTNFLTRYQYADLKYLIQEEERTYKPKRRFRVIKPCKS